MSSIAGVRVGVTAAVLLVVVASVGGYDIAPPSPVPSTKPGIIYNPSETPAPVQLEVFLDVHCGNSRSAWPLMKSVAQHYDADKLELRVQLFPMPMHRNAFLATQGVFVILNNLPNRVFDYIEANFENLSNFSTASTVNKTDTEVIDMLATLAVTSTGIDKTLFTSSLSSYRHDTVTVWKTASRRAVSATPVYFVNTVELGIGNNSPTYDDWITYLDTIVGV